MPRLIYTICVVRWPLSQVVAATLPDDRAGTEATASKALRDALDAHPQDFALYASFIDGWERCHVIHDRDRTVSILSEIGTEESAPRLHLLRHDQLPAARAALDRARPMFLEAAAKRLDGYAIEALLHWLSVGFGFVESTGLPMLVAYDVIGPSVDDETYRTARRS